MWKVTSINNETHKATVRHTDGESMDFVIPPSARRTPADKSAWLKKQTDARDAKKAKQWKRPYLLYTFIVAEAMVILALLLRH